MRLIELRTDFLKKVSPLYGTEEARAFFFLLAESYLQLKPAEIPLELQRNITDTQKIMFSRAAERLENLEPIQYILGFTEFYGLPFKITPDVLIPRPETEELVLWILQEYAETSDNISIIDIGTGSGCIAVTLAKKLPAARLTALDISAEALQIAQYNALQNNVTIQILNFDLLKINGLPQKFDCIVSNPPYVQQSEQALMSRNVWGYEPPQALFVANNAPLLFYEKIAALGLKSLNPGGKIFVEINEAFGVETIAVFQQLGYADISLKKDLYGKNRMVKAVLK